MPPRSLVVLVLAPIAFSALIAVATAAANCHFSATGVTMTHWTYTVLGNTCAGVKIGQFITPWTITKKMVSNPGGHYLQFKLFTADQYNVLINTGVETCVNADCTTTVTTDWTMNAAYSRYDADDSYVLAVYCNNPWNDCVFDYDFDLASDGLAYDDSRVLLDCSTGAPYYDNVVSSKSADCGTHQQQFIGTGYQCYTFAECAHCGCSDGEICDCDDGDKCNGQETCQSLECVAGTAPNCVLGNSCFDYSCDPDTGCVSTPDDSNSCDDNNMCNGAETCQGGLCINGTALNCTSNNPCIDGSCIPATGCHYANNNANSCEDGNMCNGQESCSNGVCMSGVPLDCNDTNMCTNDTCNAATGCQHTAVVCEDSNACTADSCDPATGCVFAPVSCNDTNACTADSCDAATGCQHTAIACNDTNPCTSDACDPASGCVFSAVTDGTSCADATVCNGAEVCQAGMCASGVSLDCEDANPCTDDACDAMTGCVHVPNDGNSCEDGNVCNGQESCSAGVCISGVPLDCNDTNPCTNDTCDPAAGCMHPADDTNICSDEDACNGEETCQSGVCVAGTPPDCDDGDVCTHDTCDTVAGCQHAPLGLAVCKSSAVRLNASGGAVLAVVCGVALATMLLLAL